MYLGFLLVQTMAGPAEERDDFFKSIAEGGDPLIWLAGHAGVNASWALVSSADSERCDAPWAEVNAALALKTHDEEIKSEPHQTEDVSEDRLCPTCKNNLVFVEGCSICIECGYSGCTSG